MIDAKKNLIVAAGALMLICPASFAGSEPAPENLVDGTPVIKQVRLSVAPAVGPCGGGFLPYSGVDCVYGDLTIAGVCEGLPVIAALRQFPLVDLGLVVISGDPPPPESEDITDIVEGGLEEREIDGLGNILAAQNPALDPNVCPVTRFGEGRTYAIRKVKKFVNRAGVISAEIQLVPRD